MVRLKVSQRGERHAGRLKFAILPRIHFGGSEAVCGREGVEAKAKSGGAVGAEGGMKSLGSTQTLSDKMKT